MSSRISVEKSAKVSRGEMDKPEPFAWSDCAILFGFVAYWALCAVAVNPVGDFALNDDWAYGLPAQWLLKTGRLRFTDWQYMTLITHVLWGTLFGFFLGPTFTAFRIASLTAGALGLAALYGVGRELSFGRRGAAVLVLTFLVNPILLSISNTFMTDSTFFALLNISIFLLLRGLRTRNTATYACGWAVIVAAVLVRQLALAPAFGLVVALPFRERLGRSWLIRAVLPTVLVAIVVTAYPKVVLSTIGLPSMYFLAQEQLKRVAVDLALGNLGALKPTLFSIGRGLMHVGWWLLPLLVLTSRAGVRRAWAVPTAAACTGLIVTAALLTLGVGMPLGTDGTLLVDFGVGPRSIAGATLKAPPAFWAAFTAVSAFGGAWLILRLAPLAPEFFRSVSSPPARGQLWLPAFLLTTAAMYYLPFGYYGPWFDRYVLPLSVLVGLLVLSRSEVRARPGLVRYTVALILLMLYAGFGVASAHDYLAWNRASWDLVNRAVRDGAPPAEIDGGFSYNGYTYWADRPGGTYQPQAGPSIALTASDPVREGRSRYVLSFEKKVGFSETDHQRIFRWLPMTPGEVFLLTREGRAEVARPRAREKPGMEAVPGS